MGRVHLEVGVEKASLCIGQLCHFEHLPLEGFVREWIQCYHCPLAGAHLVHLGLVDGNLGDHLGRIRQSYQLLALVDCLSFGNSPPAASSSSSTHEDILA